MILRRHICAVFVAALLFAQGALAANPAAVSTSATAAEPRPPKGDTPYEKKYYADPFYAEIEDAAKTTSARDVIAMLELKVQDKPERINAASLWLRDNSLGQRDLDRMDSLYFLAYSDVTLQLARAYQQAKQHDAYEDMLKTSVMSLYIYEMLAGVDAVRCADPTVLSAMRQDTLMPRYDKLNDAYSLLTKSDIDLFETTAFIADKKFERRRPNDFICDLGAAKLTDMQRQDGVQTFSAPNPATGKASMRVIPPRGYAYTPAYVDDTEWSKRREEMKKRLKKIWDDRFERLKKPAGAPAPDAKPSSHEKPDSGTNPAPEKSGKTK